METTKRGRKRYGWLLTFTVANWLAIAYMVLRVDPETMKNVFFPGIYFPAILLVAGGIFWLLAILFMSALRAVWWTVGIVLFLLLRILQLGTVINGVLILGLLISWEVYIFKTKKIKGENVE